MNLPSALSLENVSHRYNGASSPWVLDGISLRVEPGKVTALVGPNGSGKTTLIRVASGLLEAVRGTARIGSFPLPLSRMPPEARAGLVAVVPQAAYLPPDFTVEETIRLGRMAARGWLAAETEADRNASEAALQAVGLATLRGRTLGKLSGGEQQRTLIGRALAQGAPIVLLDEPTAHLDLRHQLEVLRLVRSLAAGGNYAILLALHDLNLVARFADEVFLLVNGRITASGPPKQVLREDLLSSAYGVPVQVLEHPIHHTPLVVPDGADLTDDVGDLASHG
jgi:iron complex transport system ATP-binding protein